MNVARVLAGSLARQRDTAGPIAERFRLSTETDARWNEYESEEIIASHASPSLFEGTQREFQALLDEALVEWVTGTNGSWPAFRERVRAAFDELTGTLESGQTAVVSTSGGPIAAVGVALLGLAAGGLRGAQPGGGERGRHQGRDRFRRRDARLVQRARLSRAARPLAADLPLSVPQPGNERAVQPPSTSSTEPLQ